MARPIELDEAALQRIACAARSGIAEAPEVEALVTEVRSLRAGIRSCVFRRDGELADLRGQVAELREQLAFRGDVLAGHGVRLPASGQVLATVESRSAGATVKGAR